MKNKKNDFILKSIVLASYFIFALLVFAIGFGLTYLIASSDLPDWVKFWLLK